MSISRKALFGTAAAISFLGCNYLALKGNVAASGVLLAMFVAIVVLYHLPELESFKAFNIEAKMKPVLEAAKRELLKDVAILAARIAYNSLTWQSRFGNPVKEKQSLSKEIDSLLHKFEVTDVEIRALKHEFITFTLRDLYFQFYFFFRNTLTVQQQRIGTRLRNCTTNPGQIHSPADIELSEAIRTELTRNIHVSITDKISFQKALHEIKIRELLDNDLANSSERARQMIESIGLECVLDSQMSDEAVNALSGEYNGLGERLRISFPKF